MAFRFRRTMKIAPGIRLNLTKSGVSARVGPRGAGVTVGTSGTTVSAGLPGTGLHTSKKLKSGTPKKEAISALPPPQQPEKNLGFFGWLGVLGIVAALIWGFSKLV